MSKTPNYDKKIEEILASTRPGELTCVLTGEKWMMTDEEIGWYRRFKVPSLDIGPLTRIQWVMAYFTGFAWRRSRHAKTGEPVLSCVHPGTGIAVLPDEEWFAEEFTDVGQPYRADELFFEQLHRLRLRVPMSASRSYMPSENSIAMASRGDINSYFMIATQSKNCFYGCATGEAQTSMEFYNCRGVIDSFNIIHSQRVHDCRYLRECFDCISSSFLFDCRNCEHCFGAWNKRNAKYLWWNEQVSQGEWEKREEAVNLRCRSSVAPLLEKFQNILSTVAVWPENFNEQTQNATGEYLTRAIDCTDCFYAEPGARNNFRCFYTYGDVTDCAFCGSVPQASECYFSGGLSGARDCKFCYVAVRSEGLEYCVECYDCQWCFGCMGLKKKKFHIFNKAYSEQEYWRQVDVIKCTMLDAGEYGQFIPLKYSPIYYAECGGTIYWNLPAENLKKMGAQELDPSEGEAVETRRAQRTTEEIADCIDAIDPADWKGVPIYDAQIGRRFSLLAPEIDLAKQLGVPPSNKHFLRRMGAMFHESNVGIWKKCVCASCQKPIMTAHNWTYPHRTIYCRACYLAYLEKNG